MQYDTSGGSSDTGTNVLAARPTLSPSTSAAIATTPIGKQPNASRKEAGLRSEELIVRPYLSAEVYGNPIIGRLIPRRRQAFGWRQAEAVA
jgi:hypothetical protein